MMECIIAHPELKDGTQLLRTRDAHTLYEQFGFRVTDESAGVVTMRRDL